MTTSASSRGKRVPKTLERKLSDLDDHLFLLREHLHHLHEDEAHLKIIATELRVLVCLSSWTEGLLWRLVNELGVSDSVHLHITGNVNTSHLHAQGLTFAFVPIARAGLGDPRLPPRHFSLRMVVKEHEAVFLSGQGLTHEYLIKAIAQQMGSAHEDEGVEVALAELGEMFLSGVQPYIPILAMDADLALEVGERVLEKAEQTLGFVRKERIPGYGDLSIVVRLSLREYPKCEVPLCSFRSYVSGVEILCRVGPEAMVFDCRKRGARRQTIRACCPPDWQPNTHAVFVFSYCSHAKQAHAIVNGTSQDDGIPCDIGWVHAGEFACEEMGSGHEGALTGGIWCLYGRLLSPEESLGILELPPDGYGLWLPSEELAQRSVFPMDQTRQDRS